MRKCVNCGAEIDEEAERCDKCGCDASRFKCFSYVTKDVDEAAKYICDIVAKLAHSELKNMIESYEYVGFVVYVFPEHMLGNPPIKNRIRFSNVDHTIVDIVVIDYQQYISKDSEERIKMLRDEICDALGKTFTRLKKKPCAVVYDAEKDDFYLRDVEVSTDGVNEAVKPPKSRVKKKPMSFEKWVEKQLSRRIPENVIAISFDLYELDEEHQFDVRLLGCISYDAEDPNWTCNGVFSSGKKFFHFESDNWESALSDFRKILCDYLSKHPDSVLNKYDYIGYGFFDGEVFMVKPENP